MPSPARLPRALLALALSAVLHAQTTTVVRDTFDDGERSRQDLPSSMAWFTSIAARNNLTVRNNALMLVANDNDRPVWGYFPAITLNPGDSLTLSVDVTLTRTQPSGALFNVILASTNGLPPQRTDVIPSGPYEGYGSFTNGGDSAGGTRLRKRNGPAASGASTTLFELTNGSANVVSWDTFGAARTGLAGVLQANTLYTVTLKITRTAASSCTVTTSISGGSLGANNTLTEVDSTNIFTHFDTIGFRPADTLNSGDAMISRVELVQDINTTRITNLSLLTTIPTAGDSFTMGYSVGGDGTSGPKPLVIRAAGPSLAALNLTGVLADPKLELFAGSTKTGENNNWGGAVELRDAMAAVGAFAFNSATSLDSAVLANITTQSNSAVVSSNNNGTGTVIAEIYDATPPATFSATTPRLINVSVLKHLGSGLTVGFFISGSGTRNVLVRAIGPTIGTAPFNVSGAVVDPQLTLYSGQTVIGSNDNWGGTAALTAAFSQVAAFPLPATSRDAALVASLLPGAYTVQVSGVANTTGIALVEVYELP